MDVFIGIILVGYVALAVYILYQAVMLDRYRRWNDELIQKVEYLEPPF